MNVLRQINFELGPTNKHRVNDFEMLLEYKMQCISCGKKRISDSKRLALNLNTGRNNVCNLG